MKLLDQDRLPKPEGHENAEWTLDFRYDTEPDDERDDRDRCYAMARLDKWERAYDALAEAGKNLFEVLGQKPMVPEPRRRIRAVLGLLPPRTPYNQRLEVFTAAAVCSHNDQFARGRGRHCAVGALSRAIRDDKRAAGAPRGTMTSRDAEMLALNVVATYSARPRPQKGDLGEALKLLRRFHAAGNGGGSTGTRDALLAETGALLARHPAPAKKKRPKGNDRPKA